MIGTFLAAYAIAYMPPQGQEAQLPTAKSLVEKMFAKYHEEKTKTLVGQIRLSLTAGNQTAVVDTTLQFERPDKIYLRQVSNTASRLSALLTGDGSFFSYDCPANVKGMAKRLVEAQVQKSSYLKIPDMYAAETASLIDRSFPLELAIGRRADMEFYVNQWPSLKVERKVTHREKEAFVIVGPWRYPSDTVARGDFRMIVTADGDLLQYATTETYGVGDMNNFIVPITNVWEVDLNLERKPDPNLFKVVR